MSGLSDLTKMPTVLEVKDPIGVKLDRSKVAFLVGSR